LKAGQCNPGEVRSRDEITYLACFMMEIGVSSSAGTPTVSRVRKTTLAIYATPIEHEKRLDSL
jgi:hypothetical protein